MARSSLLIYAMIRSKNVCIILEADYISKHEIYDPKFNKNFSFIYKQLEITLYNRVNFSLKQSGI